MSAALNLNSKLDFKKKDEVSTVKKSQTEQNTLENHIGRHTQTRLQSEMQKNALVSRFSLLF